MVLPGEQRESNSADRQKNRMKPKPKTVSRKFGKTSGGNDQKNNTCHQKPPQNVKRLQPRINRVAHGDDVFQSLAKGN